MTVDIALIHDAIHAGDVWVMSLAGGCGAGKSTLLPHAAEALRQQGWAVATVAENATSFLHDAGFDLDKIDLTEQHRENFQVHLLARQIAAMATAVMDVYCTHQSRGDSDTLLTRQLIGSARCRAKRAIVTDRSPIEGQSFMPDPYDEPHVAWGRVLARLGLTPTDLNKLCGLTIFAQSAAVHNPHLYRYGEGTPRTQNHREAVTNDFAVREAYQPKC